MNVARKFNRIMSEQRDIAFCNRHGLELSQIDKERGTDTYQDFSEIFYDAFRQGFTLALSAEI
jgi:hypothetical protein